MTVTRTDSTTSKLNAALQATAPAKPKAPAGEKGDTTTPTAATPVAAAASTKTTFDKAPAAHVAPSATVATSARGGHGDADPAPDHPGTPGATGSTASTSAATGGSTAWKQGGWEQKFSTLLGNDEAVGVLRDANLGEADYQKYYTELQQELTTGTTGDLGTEPASGSSSVQAASAVSGGGDTAAAASAEPVVNGWDSTESAKFTKLFALMGTSDAESKTAIASLDGSSGTPVSKEQLDKVYTQLQGALGSWNDDWKGKFTKAFADAKVPADTQAQYFAALSGGGNDDTKLQAALDAVQPGWNLKTRQMFTDMGLPADVMKDLEGKHWSVAQYAQAAKGMEGQREKAIDDGRMKKLDDAKASESDKWGVILSDLSGAKFDAQVEAIKKANDGPSIWQRIGSAALNLIPGVGLIEYAVGKDFVTGESIDRTNPFNIGMAVLSAIPIATVARTGITAIKTGATIAVDVAAEAGATAAAREGATLAAGETADVLAGATKGVSAARTFAVDSKGVATVLEGSAGAADAAKGTSLLGKLAVAEDATGVKIGSDTASAIATGGKEAGTVSQRVLDTAKYYDSGNKAIDTLRKVRAFVPGLRSVGAGGEAFKTATGLAAADTFNAQLATRLGKLSAEQLDGVAAVSKNGGKLLAEDGTRLVTEADAAAIKTATGLDVETLARVSQQAQQLGRGEGIVAQGSGKVWNFNPTKNNATVGLEDAGKTSALKTPKAYVTGTRGMADADALRLGKTVNAGTDAGFAQVAGQLDARALTEAGVETTAQARTAAIGTDLGIGNTGISRFRQLLLPNSASNVQGAIDAEAAAGATRSTASNVARYVGGRGAGLVRAGVGLTGAVVGPAIVTGTAGQQYDAYQRQQYWADRIAAEGEVARQIANGEIPDPASGLKVDPKTGLEVDEANGVAIDPATGTRYDLATGEVVDGSSSAATSTDATATDATDASTDPATAAAGDGAATDNTGATATTADDATVGGQGGSGQELADSTATADTTATGEQGDAPAADQQQLVAAGEYE